MTIKKRKKTIKLWHEKKKQKAAGTSTKAATKGRT